MRIRQVRIAGYQQFQDVRLDFTYPLDHPRVGEPLSRICLIGTNGTGKSTLLERLVRYLNGYNTFNKELADGALFALEVEHGDERYYTVHKSGYDLVYMGRIEEQQGWFEEYRSSGDGSTHQSLAQYRVHDKQVLQDLTLSEQRNDLVVYCPPESPQNHLLGVDDVPSTTLDRALRLFDKAAVYHEVSSQNVVACWEQLIYLVKKRENAFREFEALEKNQTKSVREVRETFDHAHPRILETLAELWDRLLAPAGLAFDHAAAENPIQLRDNLRAYITLKGSGVRVPYSRLSTGIRNFIFRIGHIHALHFDREASSNFLIVDEPENSLHPDFLYDLVDIYQRTAEGAQLFMATHNPIVAAQFDPAERFILRFDESDEDGAAVVVERGTTPEGDDPNDILKQDFGVRSVYGPKGIEEWERFLELRALSRSEADPEKKQHLVSEYLRLGREYNFPARGDS